MGQKGSLHTLIAAGAVRLSSEEIVRGLSGVDGVLSVETGFGAELGEDEHLMIIRSEADVRRGVSEWVHKHGLLLLEQRREQKNLEEVFRTLTT